MTTLQHPLFRNEAIQFQQHNRQWGDVASLQPLSTKVVVWFLATSAAVIILFLFVAQYARKEVAVGYLTPTTGTAKIFAPERGTIKDVHVEEGSTVREGQPLLTIETDQIAADGNDVNASMLNTLRSQKAFIADNINREEERTGSERERLRALVRGFGAEISELQSQIELQTERLKMVGSDFDAADQLKSKGFMSAVDFRRREVQVLEHKQAISALNQQLAARKNQLTEAQFSLQQLPTVMAQKVQALRNDLAYRGAAHRRDQWSPRLRDQSADNGAHLNPAGDGRSECRSTAPPA